MTDSFGLDLILAEEVRRERQQQSDDSGGDSGSTPDNRTFVYETEDETLGSRFSISPDGMGQHIPGPGTLDSLLLVADSTDYGISVQTDTAVVLDHGFDTLKEFSSEFSTVAAYERQDGLSVLSVSGLQYQQWLSVAARPNEEITFDRIRLVVSDDD